MLQVKTFDCQGCNNHCPLTVYLENNEIKEVKGNCCHRGLVSADTQLKGIKTTTALSSYTGIKKMNCTGCANHCALDVHLKKGEVTDIQGNGCRRAVISVNRQLSRLLPINALPPHFL